MHKAQFLANQCFQWLIKNKGRAIGSLIVIAISTAMNWYWLWGLLLLLWAVNDFITSQTWLSETISKRSNPILFHIIVLMWAAFGVYFIFFIDTYEYY
ncbi:MAG: hypothetical protein AAF434_15640 [Pseudomonadota bacterium]